MVPRVIENWFTDDTAYVSVRMDGNRASLYLCSEDYERPLGNYQLDGGYDLNDGLDVEGLRRTISQSVSENTRVDVELARQQVLRSEIFLPIATEQTLNQVIRFEMDRFTPFKADEVGYSCTILERIPERDKLKIELNVVRRDYLVELLAGLKELGLSVTCAYAPPVSAQQLSSKAAGTKAAANVNVDPGMTRRAQGLPGRSNMSRINLLPIDLLPDQMPLWNKSNKSLLAGILVLLGLVITLPNYLQNSRIEKLEAEIAAIKPDAVSAGENQRILIAHLEGQELLVSKKNNQSTKLENIRELTAVLPDTTWVSKLVIDGSDISIQGESTRSSDLIGILEQTKRFKNVAFASPVTRNASSNMERYEIRMQLVSFEPEGEAGALDRADMTSGAAQ